jgi:hypothetical protein
MKMIVRNCYPFCASSGSWLRGRNRSLYGWANIARASVWSHGCCRSVNYQVGLSRCWSEGHMSAK